MSFPRPDEDIANNPSSCVGLTLQLVYWVVSFLSLFLLWRKVVVPAQQLLARRPKSQPIWRNKYLSFEDMHAMFDRGDILMAGISGATTLQLAHKEVGKILETHSMYRSDPWRRLVRTITFIHITIRANSAQRSQVVSWLNQIHGSIRLFAFETNVFILATMAFSLARAHRVLGCVTEVEADAMVAAIMSMAKTLNPEDRDSGKWVPTSLSEVHEYLSKQINFDEPGFLEKIRASSAELLDVRQRTSESPSNSSPSRMKGTTFFHKPFSRLKVYLLQLFVKDVSQQILSPNSRIHPGLLLSLARMVQPLWYHLHYSACPRLLTLDGLFELLIDCDPSLKAVTDEVYEEIFGTKAADLTKSLGPGLELRPSSFPAAVGEHFKCAYYRTQLAAAKQVPQHLGVIMDGNRRFSRENGLSSVIDGHRLGARKLLQVMSWSFSAGVNNLTVWALSDDNLKRDAHELDSLFAMLAEYIREFVTGETPLVGQDVRFRVVGDRSLLPEELRRVIVAAEEATAKNRRFNLQLALGYGGRAEVMRAVRLATKARSQEESISIEEAVSKLSASDVSRFTYSAELGVPEIDAIIRTSGEKRLSGFALWETHVAELSFVAAKWPGMRQSDFLRSVMDISGRIRRHGV